MGKKKKQEFQEFRNNEKSAYKTLKIPLKTILLNCDTIQPAINNLVFEMNDLIIHTYQFIRLYILYCYSNNNPLPEFNDTFISYCIKTLGTRDNRGKKFCIFFSVKVGVLNVQRCKIFIFIKNDLK